MVIAAGQAERESEKKYLKPTTTMATVPQRSRSLHNFSSLPCFNVKWGRQKQLRCVKDSSDHHFPPAADDRNPMIEKPNFSLIPTEEAAEAPKPWNLRSRRALCKEPTTTTTNNNNNAGDRKPNFSPAEMKSPTRTSGPRARFSASLSKREIEEDFLTILGTRPARRPKKRPRYVQKQIDALFPGFWLSEITADMYKVNENPEAGKR